MADIIRMDLHIFDGGAAGSGAGGAGAGSAAGGGGAPGTAASAPTAAQTAAGEPTQGSVEVSAPATAQEVEAQRRSDFDKYIREHKDLYQERVERAVKDRFKGQRALEDKASRADALQPVLDLLASKYGVDASDAQALSRAIEEDDSFYEQAAMERGLSVAQFKQVSKLERENAEFKRAAQERERRQQAQTIYQQWIDQGEDTKRFYPDFDLRAECDNAESGSRFLKLLRSGVDVRTAYEVVHRDEIMGNFGARVAAQTQKRTVDEIRARGMRPVENGVDNGGIPAQVTKRNPADMTRQEREELHRRAMRGERVTF